MDADNGGGHLLVHVRRDFRRFQKISIGLRADRRVTELGLNYFLEIKRKRI